VTRYSISILLAAILALAGCQNMTAQDQANLGMLTGAGAGFLLADAFDANPAWTVVATLGGAAVGQQVARNNATGQCAYYAGRDSLGRPLYRTGPC
jgi:hypothetical protein